MSDTLLLLLHVVDQKRLTSFVDLTKQIFLISLKRLYCLNSYHNMLHDFGIHNIAGVFFSNSYYFLTAAVINIIWSYRKLPTYVSQSSALMALQEAISRPTLLSWQLCCAALQATIFVQCKTS